MKKSTTLLAIFISIVSYAQIGVNTLTPNGMLDVTSTTNGFLIPRVALTANNIAAPVVNPQGGALTTSTLVYNTNPVAGVNGLTVGYHYWDGSRWISFTGSNSRDWSLNGNTSTNDPAAPVTYGTSTIAATENFLGTTDANDIVFGTNNIERFRVKQTSGFVGIGTANPLYRVHASTLTPSAIGSYAENTYIGNADGVGLYGRALNNPGYGYGGVFEGSYMAGRFNNYGGTYSGSTIGVFANADGSAGTRYGGYFTATGASARSYGGYFSAGGATNNHGLVVGNGNVGIGNAFPDRAQLQVQGAIGNTVATFNLGANSLGMAMVSDWPGIYFNSYYNGGVRQMSGGNYPAMFNYNPGGQFEFSLSNTANTVAGNLAGGTFSNRLVIHRDNGAYFSYNNIGVSGLTVSSGGLWPDLGWFSLGATTASINNGRGISAAGENVGVEGRANHNNTSTTDKLGGVFYVTGYNGTASWGFPAAATIGAVVDNTTYKVFGFGVVSTIVKDTEEKDRIMVAPESPEALFQDYGIGKLTNGYAKITIDPILSKNIKVDETHPLKVFVQLEGDCKGIYVFNKTATSFEVKELQNGNSNVSFSYQIVGYRADEERAGVISKYSDMRFKPLKVQFKEVIEKREETFNSSKMSTNTSEIIPSPEVREMKSSQ